MLTNRGSASSVLVEILWRIADDRYRVCRKLLEVEVVSDVHLQGGRIRCWVVHAEQAQMEGASVWVAQVVQVRSGHWTWTA